MANQPATPVRCFRVPESLWELMEHIADDRGETMTDFALRAFEREVRRYPLNDER